MERPVTFYSQGTRVAGILGIPDDYREGEKRPGIVLCTFFTAVKEAAVPQPAQELTGAGYVTLRFDYRGFGESEGVDGHRGELFPLREVEDVRNAVSFLMGLPEVDPKKIGTFGYSMGGGISVYTAGVDDRVKAAVGVGGVYNGSFWMRGLRRKWEWDEYLAKIERDRIERVKTGKSATVPWEEVVVWTEESKRFVTAFWEEFPQAKVPQLTLETAERVNAFNCEDVVDRIAPRGVLFIGSERDTICDSEMAIRCYNLAGEPKRLVLLPDRDHYEIYATVSPDGFAQVMRETLAWYNRFIPVQGRAEEEYLSVDGETEVYFIPARGAEALPYADGQTPTARAVPKGG
jgi:alpha-beta hydrolase superfamily lysophospholipase